jgi:hypothetical protein
MGLTGFGVGTMALGAAESATGIGAIVGLPTMAVGAGIAAVGLAAKAVTAPIRYVGRAVGLGGGNRGGRGPSR